MKTVAIPIETKVREFDGKLWLGLNLVSRGYRVILGPHDEVSSTFDITEPDIYLTKDPGDPNIDIFKRLRSAGISVCGLATEGAVFESLDQFGHNKKEILNHLDAFFAWGEKPANEVRQHHDDKRNLHVSGNPRFDLLQPQLRSIYQDRAVPISKKYGEYILFNTSFSIPNPYSQRQITKIEETLGTLEQQKRTYFFRVFYSFMQTIYYLQELFPKTNIIIRPHPSENNNTYTKAFREYDRIHVEDSGDVRTWIAGATVTVHHTSTTGIESALIRVPVVSYRPVQSESYGAKLPQVVSKEALTQEELAEYISDQLHTDQPYELTDDQKQYLKQYIHNIDESAAENICRVIGSLNINGEKKYGMLKPTLGEKIERRIKSFRWSDQAITAYDTIHKLAGNESHQEQRRYHAEKFPGLTKKEIINTVDQMDGVAELGDIHVDDIPLTNNTFSLTLQG